MAGIGIAFFVADARRTGWRRWEKTALALIWCSPLFGRAVAQSTLIPLNLKSAMLLLGLVVTRITSERPLTASPFRRSHEVSAQ